MPSLDPVSLQWVVRTAAPGADVTEVRGLRDGGSPWLVRLTRHGKARNVVLRVGTDKYPSALATEIAALQLAAGHGIPAPRLPRPRAPPPPPPPRPRPPAPPPPHRRPRPRPAVGAGRAAPGE